MPMYKLELIYDDQIKKKHESNTMTRLLLEEYRAAIGIQRYDRITPYYSVPVRISCSSSSTTVPRAGAMVHSTGTVATHDY